MDANTQRPATGIQTEDTHDPSASSPSWMDSAADLVGTRIALIQAEAKQATANGAYRFASVLAAIFLAASTWLLVMTAVVGLLHTYVDFAWYWGCLSLGGIHLLLIVLLIHRARKPGPPAFQHTLSEFQKDREWLQNLKNPKSRS